jgi:predicted ATP-dependent serine protease
MIFIKTDNNYSDLQNAEIIDSKGNVITTATVEKPDGSDYFKIIYDGKEMKIREFLYNKAASSKELIKIDFSATKAVRVDQQKFKELMSKPQVEKEDDPLIDDFDPESFEIETTKLKNINFDPRIFCPIETGTYLDSFVSYKGGFLPGVNIMLTGDPGVGKSSNLMDILVNVKKNDPTKKVLYVSAEMNELDVKEFEQYYPGLEEIDFLYIGNYVTDPDLNIKPYQALMSVLHKGWDMVVMDSFVEVQSMIQEDMAMTAKKGEKWILDLMKRHNSGHNKSNAFTTFLCIQQMNKGGSYVGSKRLEHMTSAFLTLCWDKKEKGKRYMMFEKNRKGKEKIKLYYSFAKEGGIVYDETRHEKELLILERLQSPSDFGIEEFNVTDFEKLFAEDNQ